MHTYMILQGMTVVDKLDSISTTYNPRFFAQLSLLDQGCCGVPPSKVAAAALAVALRLACPPDSPALALLGPCTACPPEELGPLIKRLLDVQAQSPLSLMRGTWVTRCLDAWGGALPMNAQRRVVLSIMTAPRRMKLAGCN